MHSLFRLMEENPVIAAVREPSDWSRAVASPAAVLFLLCGDILSAGDMIAAARSAGKRVFVHLELLGGLGRDNRAVDFAALRLCPDGIISTRSAQIRWARERGLSTVQRFFLVDSQSVETALETALSTRPDYVELMPGLLPGVIRRLAGALPCGIIAGGLIETRAQAVEALSAGAGNVSTSCAKLWEG